MNDSEDYSKRLLADFIAARLRAKQVGDGVGRREPVSPEPEQPNGSQAEQGVFRGPGKRALPTKRPHAASTPTLPLFDLGSSN